MGSTTNRISPATDQVRAYVRKAGSKHLHWLELNGQDVGKDGQRRSEHRYVSGTVRMVDGKPHLVRCSSSMTRTGQRGDGPGDFVVRFEDKATATAAKAPKATTAKAPTVTKATRPERGNYTMGGKLFRVCGYEGHEGDRHLPGDDEHYFIRKSGPRAGQPVDICRACLKLRGQGYAGEVKAATEQAASVRVTAAQRRQLADLPELTGRNRATYRKLADLGLVTIGEDDTIRRTLTGSKVVQNGGQA